MSLKFAVSADLHLTSVKNHPERFETLGQLLRQCGELGIERLVIAGDLFDRQQQNFSDFERVYRSSRPDNLQVIILPGNHDPELRAEHFTVDGLQVITEPTAEQLEAGIQLVYIPYRPNETLGKLLAEFQSGLAPRRWLLVSHADWLGGQRQPSADEPGVYMPLTQRDLQIFQPSACLLGHIHRPFAQGRVHYAGSPCPLDISETGRRRLLIFDSASQKVLSEPVRSPRLYFDEKILMLPMADEREYLQRQLQAMRQRWGIAPEGFERVVVRLRLIGYCRDRSGLAAVIQESLADINFYADSPDLSALKVALDPDRNEIAKRVNEAIERMEVEAIGLNLSKAEIMEQALAIIYEQ